MSYNSDTPDRSFRTFIMIKPDAVSRGLESAIFDFFATKNLVVMAYQRSKLSSASVDALYTAHIHKPFYEAMKTFITSGPTCCAILQGHDAIQRTIELVGDKDPLQAKPGTIRYTWGISIDANSIHRSDSLEAFEREKSIFFPTISLCLH